MAKSASINTRIDSVLIKLPNETPVFMDSLSKEELDAEIEKGYVDALEGRTISARKAISEMRKDLNI